MGINVFFAVASPTTLASLIVDCQQAEPDASKEVRTLRAMAEVELESNVGKEEAEALIRRAA